MNIQLLLCSWLYNILLFELFRICFWSIRILFDSLIDSISHWPTVLIPFSHCERIYKYSRSSQAIIDSRMSGASIPPWVVEANLPPLPAPANPPPPPPPDGPRGSWHGTRIMPSTSRCVGARRNYQSLTIHWIEKVEVEKLNNLKYMYITTAL